MNPMRNKLKMMFGDEDGQLKLLQWSFVHHKLDINKKVVRDRNYQGENSVYWRKGLAGLSVFMLVNAASSGKPPVIEYDKGSLLFAIDYADDDNRNWLSALFGKSQFGPHSAFHDLVIWDNQRQKNSKLLPVALQLKESMLRQSEIEVKWLGRGTVIDHRVLHRMAMRISRERGCTRPFNFGPKLNIRMEEAPLFSQHVTELLGIAPVINDVQYFIEVPDSSFELISMEKACLAGIKSESYAVELFRLGRYRSAFQHYRAAARFHKRGGQAERAVLNLINCLPSLRAIADAGSIANTATSVTRELENWKNHPNVFNAMVLSELAVTYMECGYGDESVKPLERSIELFEQAGDEILSTIPEQEIKIQELLARRRLCQLQSRESLTHGLDSFNELLERFREERMTRAIGNAPYVKACIYRFHKQDKKALNCLEEHENQLQMGTVWTRAVTHIAHGFLLWKDGQKNRAREKTELASLEIERSGIVGTGNSLGNKEEPFPINDVLNLPVLLQRRDRLPFSITTYNNLVQSLCKS